MKQRQQQHPQQRKKSSNSRKILAALLFCAAVISLGCSESPKAPPTQPAPSQPAAQPIAPQQTKPEIPSDTGKGKIEVKYTYAPGGRRDPFAPIIAREEKKEQRATALPLERYAVTDFKLSGIVWGGFGYNAMLEGPDGKGYFVRVGTVLGQNRGVIRKITKDSLIVEETFKNYMGVTERKEITITLRKKQEGLP